MSELWPFQPGSLFQSLESPPSNLLLPIQDSAKKGGRTKRGHVLENRMFGLPSSQNPPLLPLHTAPNPFRLSSTPTSCSRGGWAVGLLGIAQESLKVAAVSLRLHTWRLWGITVVTGDQMLVPHHLRPLRKEVAIPQRRS